MMYEGLVLYVKEMDEDRYQKLCSVSYYLSIETLQAYMPELHVYDQLPSQERDQRRLDESHGNIEHHGKWGSE